MHKGEGDCVGMDSPGDDFRLYDCVQELPFICQTSQTTHPDAIEKMGIPEYVHPLDNVTDTSVERNVGFSNLSVSQTELAQPALFRESANSYFEEFITKNISTTYGLTITMWIRLRKNSTMRIPIWVTGSQNPFYMYFRYNQLRFRMCENIACTNSSMRTSHKMIQLNVWTFIAMTYNNEKGIGYLFINETYGTDGAEGSHYTFKTNGWFKNHAIGNTMTIGASHEDNSGFPGEMSCLQISNKFLSPAQVYQLSQICHVDVNYKRSKPCPPGYKLIHEHCYKLSTNPLTYTEAELSCLSDPNDPYVTQLNIPVNFEILEMLSLDSKKAINTSQIWTGLDSMSGMTIVNHYFTSF